MEHKDCFVYVWHDTRTNVRYYGYHKGDSDDGYVCSGNYMLTEYNIRPDDFIRTILFCGTQKECLMLEERLICSHPGFDGLYNANIGSRFIHNEAVRKKISESRKGIKFTEQHLANMRKAAKTRKRKHSLTDEHKAKISRSLKNHEVCDDTRRKISEKLSGRKKDSVR